MTSAIMQCCCIFAGIRPLAKPDITIPVRAAAAERALMGYTMAGGVAMARFLQRNFSCKETFPVQWRVFEFRGKIRVRPQPGSDARGGSK